MASKHSSPVINGPSYDEFGTAPLAVSVTVWVESGVPVQLPFRKNSYTTVPVAVNGEAVTDAVSCTVEPKACVPPDRKTVAERLPAVEVVNGTRSLGEQL